jgi:hypothetical protein
MPMKSSLTVSFTLLVAFSASAYAQPWSAVLAPSRAVDWSSNSPGVVGGIPSAAWAQCKTTACNAVTAAGASATAAQINAAIASAPSSSYVALSAGSYSLSSGINMGPNVVLRGAGPNNTFLVFSGGTSCGGEGGQICFKDGSGYFYGSTAVQVGGTNSATVCGTGSSGACNNAYGRGATTLQLSNVGSAGIVNGQYIYLDQVNDNPATPSTSWQNGMLICDNTSPTDGCSLEGTSPGRCASGAWGAPCPSGAGTERNLIQIVKVVSGCTSGCSGAGPFNVTITPGLYGQKWNAAQAPGAWWSSNNMQNAGVEDLSIDSTAVGTSTESGIYFDNAFNCWASNVRSISPNRNHVWFWQSAHITVQNSYFFGTQNEMSQSYGIESFIASDNLVVNNIFQQVTQPVVMGPAQGIVFAYNFAIHDTYYTPAWLQQGFAYRHDAGTLYNLSEGNLTSGYWEDVFHGTGGANTTFRNYAVGWEAGRSEDTVPVQLFAYNRFENFIGNVLGCNNATSAYPGNCGAPYHTAYETHGGVGQGGSIYDLNAGNSESATRVLPDPYVETSLMRWGNYDVVNAATRFVTSEVPSGLTDGYANPVPASQALPASFWTTKPSWWGSIPWPAIGPDVTGGNVPGVAGHVYLNPAANCYLTTLGGPADGSGSVLPFNAKNCYGSTASTSPTPPAAPTGLTATVR